MNTKLLYGIIALLVLTIASLGYVYVERSEQPPSPTPAITTQEPLDTQEPTDTQDLASPAEFMDMESTGTELSGAVTVSSGWIENPTTGDLQSVRLYEPTSSGPYPLVILIPGGSGDGSSFERPNLDTKDQLPDTINLAHEGFIVVVYSPLGTGDSEGEVNYQGHDDQDGLAAIIAAAQALPQTDADNTGLASFSYGVTGAAGVLARYPELGVKYWSDWEGPSSRFYTTVGCPRSPSRDGDISPANFPCSDDAHWDEREASIFIQSLSLDYYWRIQEDRDHVQPSHDHTLEMLDGALENSNIQWVRVNDGEINTAYTADTLPTVPNTSHFPTYALPHIVELSQM